MERGTEDSNSDLKREEKMQKDPKIKDKRLIGCYKSFLIGCWVGMLSGSMAQISFKYSWLQLGSIFLLSVLHPEATTKLDIRELKPPRHL